MPNKRFHIANILTVFRIVIVPFFILSLFGQSLFSGVAALVLFFTAAVSDYLDGVCARKYRLQSGFGEFVDPLADKILVGAAFLSFTLFPEFNIPLWLVIIILVRELVVTLLRVVAIKKKTPLKTEYSGKIKTAFQMLSIVVILVMLLIKKAVLSARPSLMSEESTEFWRTLFGQNPGTFIYFLPLLLVSLSAVLALFSMGHYVLKNRHIISTLR